MRKYSLLLIILLFLTGCWDQIQIEERGFVIGVAVDEVDDDSTGDSAIQFTQQIVVPGNLSAGAGSAGQSAGGNADAYLNESITGETVYEVVRDVAARTSRTPFFAHLQGIVISQSIAEKKDLGEMLDFLIRDPEMRRGSLVVISKGNAGDVLDVAPNNERLPMRYIHSISENEYKNAEIYPKTRIGDVHEALLQNKSIAMSMLVKREKLLELQDTAIINGQSHRMVGTLDRKATMGLNFILDQIRGGIIKTHIEGKPILYEIYRSKTRIKADVKERDDITFKVKVQLEGALGETLLAKEYTENEHISDLEKHFENEIKTMILKAVDDSQELKTDALEFGEHLRQNHYDFWKDIKNDWEKGENLFSKVNVEVDAKAIIRTTGSQNKTESTH